MKKKIVNSLIVILSLFPLLFSVQKPLDANANLGGYSIEHYNVEIEVSETGLYTITETLDVHFHKNRHGIYFQVPNTYHMTWNIDGEEVVRDYTFPIVSMKLLSGQKYERDGGTLKIGDKDYYANEYETYKIKYAVQTKDLKLDGLQSLYWNIISDKWEEDILSSSFKITMPKSFDESAMYFYTDGEACNPNLDVSVSGNVITGELNEPFSYGQAITIKLDLPNDYFKFPNYSGYYIVIFAIGLMIFAFSFLLYFKRGRKDLVVKTVEFTAPKGVSSASVGFIVDGKPDTRDIISLLFDWGSKGYITINENTETGSLTINKVQDLPKSAGKHEHYFFKGLFGSKDSVNTKSLPRGLYDDVSMSKVAVADENDDVFASNLKGPQTTMRILSFIPLTLLALVSGYLTKRSVLAEIFAIGMSYGFMYPIVILLLTDIIKYKEGTPWIKRFIRRLGAYSVMLFCTIGVVIVDADAQLYAFIFYALSCVILLLSCKVVKRSEEGLLLYGKVLGLKEFILRAEKDRLDMLVKENPQYFYDILPYAYAFNLTKVWSQHFKNIDIAPPTYYTGRDVFTPMAFTRSLDRGLDSIARASIPPASTRSGGGSFGGSSGGGSSGGGFGGSSGGSW